MGSDRGFAQPTLWGACMALAVLLSMLNSVFGQGLAPNPKSLLGAASTQDTLSAVRAEHRSAR